MARRTYTSYQEQFWIDGITWYVVDADLLMTPRYQELPRIGCGSQSLFHQLHMATIRPMGQEQSFKPPGLSEFRQALVLSKFKATEKEYVISSINDHVLDKLIQFLGRAQSQLEAELDRIENF